MAKKFKPSFGWLHPDKRTKEQNDTDDALKAQMPMFDIIGQYRAVQKVTLWDSSKAVLGQHLECFYQEIGSCIGMGVAKAEWYLQCLEVLRGDPEQVIMPYEPYGYAQSRVMAGISGNEDGSTGAGAAAAAKKYGVLRSDLEGLPKWRQQGDTIIWPGDVDKSWGRNGAPKEWIEKGVKHLIKTTSVLKNADKVTEALVNKYPVCIASSWGGDMKPGLQGEPAVRLNKHATEWMHQMMCCAYWDHPSLGEIFYIQNSWGENAHGKPADDEPPGGFWVLKKDMDYIAKQGETIAYSQFDGFPADQIPWIF